MTFFKRTLAAAAVIAAVLPSAVSCSRRNDPGKINAKANEFIGTWKCDRAYLSIMNNDGNYQALVMWINSSDTCEEWTYPLNYMNGRFICFGSGCKYDLGNIKLKEDGSYDTSSFTPQEGLIAEFYMTEEGIVWKDLNENRGKDRIFTAIE